MNRTKSMTVREAARRRTPLDGADAQALEGALSSTECERDAAREAVSMLRSQLQIARIFVEGKALTPDTTVLMAFDIVLAETKRHSCWSPRNEGTKP